MASTAEDLQRRLSEAEATIEVLLSERGDVAGDGSGATPLLLSRAQHELKRTRELYGRERDRAQRYLDAADVILLALDLEGRVTLINRYACEVLGWGPTDLIGKHWITCCTPERFRESREETFTRILAGDLTLYENPILTTWGDERLIEWRHRLIKDDHGNVTGVFSCGTDITTRTAVVEALRTTEERMRFALEAANVGIWDVDLRTGSLKLSPQLEAIYGMEPGTFAGTVDAFIARVHPDDRSRVVAAMQQANATGADFDLAHRTIWPDGSVHWLNGAGRIIQDDDGRPVRGLGITRDVTEARALESQHEQLQKMEAIGQLASGVAHDFNNLLTVILGFAEMMSLGTPTSSENGRDLAEIIKAAQRASGLTRQLLAFSRQQVLNAAAIDLNALISDMAGMLRRLIGENIEVVLALSPAIPHALADKGQIEQVIMNLVVNARDAMPEGGVMTIATGVAGRMPPEAGDAPESARYVIISVKDSGMGMTRETQSRLFDPFFTTKPAGKGTGLGLSTSYGIVKQSKGFIEVESVVGLGTTFCVYLPVTEEAPAAAIADRGAGPMAEAVQATVLLVEDEPGVRKLAKRLISNAGFRVIEASNGDEAEAEFVKNSEAIDLVLTDMIMPGCGGPELVRRLRARSPSVKVLFMSGYTEHSAEEEAARESGLPFLQKPFTAVELLRRVRQALLRA